MGDRVTLPKRLAGLKVPKRIRKGAARDVLDSARGREVLQDLVRCAEGATPVQLAAALDAAHVAFRDELASARQARVDEADAEALVDGALEATDASALAREEPGLPH